MEDDKREVEDQLQQMTLEDKPQQQQPQQQQQEQPPTTTTTTTTTTTIPEIVKNIDSPLPQTRLQAARQIRQLLAAKVDAPIDEVIENGALPKLIAFLGEGVEEGLQMEAAWALTNIASGTSEQTNALVEAGAIDGFVNLLSSKKEEIREQAIWALGNIAGDSAFLRNVVLQSGALEPILGCIVGSQNMALIRNGVWAVSNMCRGRPSPPLHMITPAIPALATFLSAPDTEMLADACWALSYITDGMNDRIDAVLKEESIVPMVVELLDHENPNVQTASLRTIGNIVTGEEEQTQAVLDCPMALPLLKKLLHDPNQALRKEGCWALSNITAGTQKQIQMVIEEGMIPLVIAMVLSNEDDNDIKKEAVWTLGNIFSCGSVDQIAYLVEQNVIPVFFSYLGNGHHHATVLACLDGIDRILDIGKEGNRFGEDFVAKIEASEDFQNLEELQMHQNLQIYEKAHLILKKHFGGESEEEGEVLGGFGRGENSFHF